MARLTKKELVMMASELLSLKELFDRYRSLEKAIKDGMVKLDLVGDENGIEVQQGRVFVIRTERVTVSPELAEEVLGKDAAGKVIVTKRSVPNNRLGTLAEAGVISEQDFGTILERAERKPVVNLYVRPLK